MNILQKLFVKEKDDSSSDSNTTVEAETTETTPLPPKSGLWVARKTDVGQQREQNEDTLYAFDAYIESNEGISPFGLFIVADGMGGYQKGEVASDLATRTAASYILKNIYLPYINKDEGNASQTPINEVLTSAGHAANKRIIEEAPEAGTTLTIAVIMGHHAYLAHVGDSRAYVYHEGKLKQITKDHSLVARLVELGQATPEEALTHPQRNVLYRALGQSGTLEVDTYLSSLPANSYLLICSDGLWGMLTDEMINTILDEASSPDDAVNTLIIEANAQGGDDNITAILIGVGE